ncbi:hypothetical protein QEN19_001556 [Hanseniaspora menglaensis]
MTKEENDVVMGNTSDSEGEKKAVDKSASTPVILSEEDLKLKIELENLAKNLLENDNTTYMSSLDKLNVLIKEATTSMTAVPKPLKFLRPFVDKLVLKYEDLKEEHETKSKLADVLSVLFTTFEDTGSFQVLKYRCLSDESKFDLWGHEYVRHLSLQMGEAYNKLYEEDEEEQEQEAEEESREEVQDEIESDVDSKENKFVLSSAITQDKILQLADIVVPYFIEHNGETDAVDLLSEIDNIELISEYADSANHHRVCKYMVACAPLLPQEESKEFLGAAYKIFFKNNKYSEALNIAIRLDDSEKISTLFETVSDDKAMKMQLSYTLAEQRLPSPNTTDEFVAAIVGNVNLSKNYKHLVKNLNLLPPKVPEDVYKSHLENTSFFKAKADASQQNLASAFVNGYLNLGYGEDNLILKDDSSVYKTKGDGMTSTVASIGAIKQWDVEGLQDLDKYLYVDDVKIKAGALIGVGLATSGIHDGEVETALVILEEYLSSSDETLKRAAIIGLTIAFSGSKNEELMGLLLPLVTDMEDHSIETASLAALALGHVFVGTGNADIAEMIVLNLLERPTEEMSSPWAKFMCLGLGLLFLGMGDNVDDAIEVISAMDHPMATSIETLIMICAFAGSGDVLFIQDLLSRITDDNSSVEEEDGEEVAAEDNAEPDAKFEEKNEDDKMEVEDKNENSEETKQKEEEETLKKSNDLHQSFYAVLGIATTVMGENIGKEMSLRHFGHLMHYGNDYIKRAVPLALSLLSVSNPQINIYETLSRYSHDEDLDVSSNAIYAMGLLGAGTNNSRLAQLLRNLASYYSNSNSLLFMTRMSQGLVHLGKGTLTLDCYNDSGVLNKTTLASLLTVMVGLTEPTFMTTHHYLFYMLNLGMRPKYIVTIGEDGEPLQVNVRVGQAVDTVGQAGKPKDITGWTTHATPVLINHNERAELETNEYICLSDKIEGVVVLKKNPDYKDE